MLPAEPRKIEIEPKLGIESKVGIEPKVGIGLALTPYAVLKTRRKGTAAVKVFINVLRGERDDTIGEYVRKAKTARHVIV